MPTQTHAEIISTIRRISWPAILKGEYDPAKASDYQRIVQDMKAAGVTLPVDPREALDLACAINAELNWCEWEHPALLAVLWALPEVIEQTKDQDVLVRYIASVPRSGRLPSIGL